MAKIKLGTIRNSKGYSIRKLVVLSGVSKSTIQKIESGMCSPTVNTVEKLAWALEVELFELIEPERRKKRIDIQ